MDALQQIVDRYQTGQLVKVDLLEIVLFRFRELDSYRLFKEVPPSLHEDLKNYLLMAADDDLLFELEKKTLHAIRNYVRDQKWEYPLIKRVSMEDAVDLIRSRALDLLPDDVLLVESLSVGRGPIFVLGGWVGVATEPIRWNSLYCEGKIRIAINPSSFYNFLNAVHRVLHSLLLLKELRIVFMEKGEIQLQDLESILTTHKSDSLFWKTLEQSQELAQKITAGL